MAKDKKSFVLYSDQRNVVDLLTDEQAGKLFKHLFAYVNDENPVTDDQLITIAFAPIKQQLKRDLVKYEEKLVQWSEAGKRSAAKRKEKQRPSTTVAKRSTDSTVNVNVNVNDNVINKDIPVFSEFKEYALSKKKDVCMEALQLKYDSWIENGWKNGNDKAIKNWKSTLLNTLPFLNKQQKEGGDKMVDYVNEQIKKYGNS